MTLLTEIISIFEKNGNVLLSYSDICKGLWINGISCAPGSVERRIRERIYEREDGLPPIFESKTRGEKAKHKAVRLIKAVSQPAVVSQPVKNYGYEDENFKLDTRATPAPIPTPLPFL